MVYQNGHRATTQAAPTENVGLLAVVCDHPVFPGGETAPPPPPPPTTTTKKSVQKTRTLAIVMLAIVQVPILILILAFNVKYFRNFHASVALLYTNLDLHSWYVHLAGLHIYFGTFAAFLGPLQLYLGFRKKAGTWLHKYAGYAYTLCMALVVIGAAIMIGNRCVDTGFAPFVLMSTYVFLTIYTAISLTWGIVAILKGSKSRHRAMMLRTYMAILAFAIIGRLPLVAYGVKMLMYNIDVLDPNISADELNNYYHSTDMAATIQTVFFYPSIMLFEYVMFNTPFVKILQGE